MEIYINEYFKMVTADDGKLLSQKENGEAHIMKIVYVPLAMSDADIEARYTEIDENEFEISIDAENQTYSKLEIRRACRELGIENKLNLLLESSAEFKNDWLDAQCIDLTDSVLLEALKAGKFTDDEIKTIKDLLNDI